MGLNWIKGFRPVVRSLNLEDDVKLSDFYSCSVLFLLIQGQGNVITVVDLSWRTQDSSTHGPDFPRVY